MLRICTLPAWAAASLVGFGTRNTTLLQSKTRGISNDMVGDDHGGNGALLR